MKVIYYYTCKLRWWYRRITVLIAFFLIVNILCAQEVWTKDDSTKLIKILNNETPLCVDNDFKRELENLFIGNLIENNSSSWNDFILDIKPDDFFLKKYETMNLNNIFNKPIVDKFFNIKNKYLKFKKFTINSHVDVDNPFIYIFIQRNTNLSFPLNKKIDLNISDNYTLDKSHSPILPINPTPYSIGVGFSYSIKKNMGIGSHANYQYNIIQKKWEWFWVFKFTILF